MAKLTSFSKFLITLLIIGSAYLGIQYALKNTDAGRNLSGNAKTDSGGGLFGGGKKDKNTISNTGTAALRPTLKAGTIRITASKSNSKYLTTPPPAATPGKMTKYNSCGLPLTPFLPKCPD